MNWNKSMCQQCNKLSECERTISNVASQNIVDIDNIIDGDIKCEYFSELIAAVNEHVKNSIIGEIMSDKPIKIVCEDINMVEDTRDDMIIKISRRLTLLEVAELFNVSVEDVLNGKIGYWVVEE